jgi:beta-xylosidase-like protein
MSAAASSDTRFREELNRLLTSPEFSASRQLQEFLRYTSERAFEGASQLEQVEIAEAVLGKGRSFNPVEDASVRKLASLARQRLDQYYARTGQQDEIVVSLPVRSYIPRYDVRLAEVAAAPVVSEEKAAGDSRKWPRVLAALGVLCGLVAGAAVVLVWRGVPVRERVPSGTYTLMTKQGDISSPGSDAAPNSVQLGPTLREFDDVSTVMMFAPMREAQQAGLLVWQDDDHYILLGRRFLGRNQLVFALEENGAFGADSMAVRYDPDGQSGRPLWMVIRKDGDLYRGFVSSDGSRWQEVGPPLRPKQAFQRPRAAIYALNGRRETLSANAKFVDFSTGVTFTEENGPLPAGWKTNAPCASSLSLEEQASALQFSFKPGTAHCNAEWTRPIPQGNWEFVTKMDFFPQPGVSAGIGLRGSKGAVRLARYILNGPSVCLIHDAKTLVGLPDLNGSPTIYLRLRNLSGVLTGAFSADGVHYQELASQVKLADLGDHVQSGLRFSVNEAREGEGSLTARFLLFHEMIGTLRAYR